jgi:hypothetical protein
MIPGCTDDGCALEVECHIVGNLQAKLFIGTGVMAQEGMVLDFRERTGMIGSCHNLCFPISVSAKPGHRLLRPLLIVYHVADGYI